MRDRRYCHIVLLLATLFPCKVVGQANEITLPVDGQVVSTGELTVAIQLVGERPSEFGTPASILGAPVHILERRVVRGRPVDVRLLTLLSLDAIGDTLYAIAANGGRIPPLIRPGQGVDIQWPTNHATVELRANPPGTNVLWKGRFIGVVPFSRALYPGNYKFAFSLERYAVAEEIVSAADSAFVSASTSLQALPTAADYLTEGARLVNGSEFEAAQAALEASLESHSLYGGLSDLDIDYAQYLLDTTSRHQDLISHISADPDLVGQHENIVAMYLAVRRMLRPNDERDTVGAVGFVDNLYAIIPEYAEIAGLYRTYVLPTLDNQEGQ